MHRIIRQIFIYLRILVRRVDSFRFDYFYAGRNLSRCDRGYRYASGANPSQSSPLWKIRYIFRNICRIEPGEVLVDAGCGHGRVIMWWLKHHRRNKIYGVEIDPQIAEQTRRLFVKYPNVEIIAGDILENLPENAGVFYLFNPFQQKIINLFKQKVEEKYRPGIKIIYYYPLCYSIFKIDPKWEVREFHKPEVLFAHRADFPFAVVMEYTGLKDETRDTDDG